MSKKTLTKEGLIEFYNSDLSYYKTKKELCKKYSCKGRLPGLSEIVSENIIKFCLLKNNVNCNNGKVGDLVVNDEFKYECKCFTSDGPISFGPNEQWHSIILLDGREWFNNHFRIILINLKNSDSIWQNIKVNKTETFRDQCNQKRRPRINYDALDKQLDIKYKKVLFEGKLEDILN